jgi:hypothetical protein
LLLLLSILYVTGTVYATHLQGLNERLIVIAAFGWQVVMGYQLLRPCQDAAAWADLQRYGTVIDRRCRAVRQARHA